MADEQPPRLAICDVKFENSELVGKKTYVSSKSNHLRVRFDETSKPDGFYSVGDGVAYVSSQIATEENIDISETGNSATLDKLREGVYGWTEGLPDGITWQMQILILPEGYTLQNPSAIPNGAKQFNERLAVFWLLNGSSPPRQTRVIWDLRKTQDDLSAEVQRINTRSYMTIPSPNDGPQAAPFTATSCECSGHWEHLWQGDGLTMRSAFCEANFDHRGRSIQPSERTPLTQK